MVTNIDLVQSQILVAEGYPLDSDEIHIKSQKDVQCIGYSIPVSYTHLDVYKGQELISSKNRVPPSAFPSRSST